jgi:serine/threonine protein phosphatase PrpC
LNAVVLSEGCKLLCANVGDSRTILGRTSAETGSMKFKPFALSCDHKPSLPIEYKRINSFGGRVESYYDNEGILYVR